MDGIMVSAATGVMNSLLCKLTTVLEEEYKLNQRVKCHITFLKDELSSMGALLEKLSEKEKLDPQTEEWRDQVREMAYDIEDCIDMYMHQVHQMGEKPRSIMGLIFKYIDKVKKLGNYNDIVEKIQDLKARVIEAGDRRKRYKVDMTAYSNGTGMVPIDPRLPALYAEASGLVGIDGPTNEIIKMVTDDEQLLKVVSILGLGGLGKTTLANQVYQSIIVAERFQYRAFVCVSQKPDMRNIFHTIFSQLTAAKCLNTAIGDEECLINAIRNFLKDKRYFAVIDDVWNSQVWKIIKCALLENLCGSRIIVTTRIASVAKACCFSRHHLIYQLRPLSEADSKSLFFRRTFGPEGQCPPHLIEVSAEIIKKCGGLPLAILTMSSLLNTKSDRREEWVRIQNSIGLGLEKNPDVEEMRRILSLSYTDLPPHLKTCLLYLSMYPEDNVIHMQNLVRRWIAEGFVKVTSGRNLMEEGECYFNELINRSLIQPAHMRYDGKAMACHVHDMILEFVVSKAVEENFITFCSDKTQTLVYKGTVRRLYIDHHNQENVMSVSSTVASHIRSLSIFGYSEQTSPISDFQALRVVYINSYRKLDNSYLQNIGKLFQLRYLCIEEINVTQLPQQIGELQFLETLDIFRTAVYEFPASIVELQHLKHLYSCANLPEGIGKMKALEELGVWLVQDGTSASSLKELGNLTKLRTLNLRWFGFSLGDTTICVNNFVSSLTKLGAHNLQVLNLLCADSIITRLNSWSPPPRHMRELNIHCIRSAFCGIPLWMDSPANLTKLCISVNQVNQNTLRILGSLPALLSLELRSKEAHEMLTLHNHGFQHLKVFRMINPVMGLTCKAGAMPKLEELTIEIMAQGIQSSYYHHPDLGIHYLSALKELTVSINYKGAKVEDVDTLKDLIRNAATLVPNLRKLILYTSWEDFIRSSASSSSGQGSGGPRIWTNGINGIFSLEVPSILRTQLSGTKLEHLEHRSISKMQWRWR